MKEYLTIEARAGYDAPENAACPHLHSSPRAMAWQVGRWLRRTGRSAPRGVRMSRGYTLHVNDMLVAWNVKNEISRIN